MLKTFSIALTIRQQLASLIHNLFLHLNEVHVLYLAMHVYVHSILQVPHLASPSLVLTSLRMSMEL